MKSHRTVATPLPIKFDRPLGERQKVILAKCDRHNGFTPTCALHGNICVALEKRGLIRRETTRDTFHLTQSGFRALKEVQRERKPQ